MSLGSRWTVLAVLVAPLLLAFAFVSCSQQPPNQTPPASQASSPASPTSDPVQHGQYLVETIGCGHCHTPGGIYGEPDPTRLLSGSEVGWKGRWGVSYPRNLTPDSATGIGKWTEDDIAKTILELKRPDGSVLHLPMPWFHFVHLTEGDVHAIAKYLKTIPAVQHHVPDFVPPGGKVSGAVIDFPPPPAWDAPRYR